MTPLALSQSELPDKRQAIKAYRNSRDAAARVDACNGRLSSHVADDLCATFKTGITRLIRLNPGARVNPTNEAGGLAKPTRSRAGWSHGVVHYALKSAENFEEWAILGETGNQRAIRTILFLKPSEALPHCSELLVELVHKHHDTSAYRVINGAIPNTAQILELPNQWGYLFYTDNGRIAVQCLTTRNERVGGVFDGRRNPVRRQFETVIVEGIDENDSLLQEEIFGSDLLPIVAVDSQDEAIGFINVRLDQVRYEPLTMRRAAQAHPTHHTSPNISMR
ncbi:hypothetical protein EDD15DRAFT_2201518 [Pisolithus albus]|nr:hypothetical protein EDD15DRAFT_2201518 [Pisolithus albus]